ncbi:hypothetical protein PBY51_022714 [Eleginops maclovinus]|uniref:Uncharacterized protein n=1 Tax=Eleginops maclovinus TaxID=56733 RepID=A0AAN7XI22_ELEMC|nr:hypothetical protein PBY51_022714 [Eleginops maclovinus]
MYFQDTCRDPYGGALVSTGPCPVGCMTNVIHPVDPDINGCNVCQVVYTASYSDYPQHLHCSDWWSTLCT